MSDNETRLAPAEAMVKVLAGPVEDGDGRPAQSRLVSAQALPAAQPFPSAGDSQSPPVIAPHETNAGLTPGPWPTPLLDPAAFRSDDPEMRLRDMLAFAHAAESGGAVPDVAALRLRAEGELNAFAYRLLHNRVDEIRREAMQEQIAGMRPTLSFATLVAANASALFAAGMLGAVLWGLIAAVGGR